MNEHRRAKRKRVQEQIEVLDAMTEQPVGRVGNMSETGMMMLATAPLVDDALYQLRFTLTIDRGASREVEIGAHQLWTDPTHVPGQSWSGFRFIDVSAADGEHLRAWIEQPGSQFE